MRRFLVAVLAGVLAWAAPAQASHRQASYEGLVRWAGCEARLVTRDDIPTAASIYSPERYTLYIGTEETEGLRSELAEMILFHEIGHCLQDQMGGIEPGVRTELDADRYAAQLACALGRDGVALLREVFEWARGNFGYDGDPGHGTLAQRISQGQNATFCKKPGLQAPFHS
jgi:hypothetical protein